jgi:hypothetical protein
MARDSRNYQRLRVNLDIEWAIATQGLSGTGQLVDVSLLGASFVIDNRFTVERAVLFGLRVRELEEMPNLGRLRWFRRLGAYPVRVLVGVIFEGAVTPAWSDWVYQTVAAQAEDNPDG